MNWGLLTLQTPIGFQARCLQGMDAFSLIEPRPDGSSLLLLGVRQRNGLAVTFSFQRVVNGSFVSPVIVRHVPSWEGVACEIIGDKCYEEFVGDPLHAMALLEKVRGELIDYLVSLL